MEEEKLRLSYSAISTYLMCPKKYYWEYKMRYTNTTYGVPLWFGSAIDNAAEKYLITKDREKSNDEFVTNMTNGTYNKDAIYIPTMLNTRYSKSDMQLELLEDSDIESINEKAKELGFDSDLLDIEAFVKYVQQERHDVGEDEYRLFNNIGWHCLYRKGLMLLDIFYEWADENIKAVHSTQKKIEIENELGDVLVGYPDMEVTLKDGKRYTLDLKTSSVVNQAYPDDILNNTDAMQLHIYSQESTNNNIGYIVLDKNIRKRDPRVRFKIITGTVDDEVVDNSFDLADEVLRKIRAGNFEGECNFHFGKCICSYHEQLSRGDVPKGIVKRK